jgi:hypothetical protein
MRGWKPPASAKIYGSVDYGYGAPFSFHLHAVLPGNHVRTFFEIYKRRRARRRPGEAIRAAIERFMDQGMQKPEWIVYDPQMDGDRAEVNIVQTIADVYHEHLADPLQHQDRAGRQGEGRAARRIQRVKDALAPMADGFPHWDVTEDCERPDPHAARSANRRGRPGIHRRGRRGPRLRGLRALLPDAAGAAAARNPHGIRRARPAEPRRAAREGAPARRAAEDARPAVRPAAADIVCASTTFLCTRSSRFG